MCTSSSIKNRRSGNNLNYILQFFQSVSCIDGVGATLNFFVSIETGFTAVVHDEFFLESVANNVICPYK